MFRLGSVLFIPAYLGVIPVRPFAAASGGRFVVASGERVTFLLWCVLANDSM
jgi:hypothetical protein